MTGGTPRIPNSLLIAHSLIGPKRRVFFSFHYARDAWSVGQIRNSWIGNPRHEAQPFLDKAQWETIQRRGDAAIRTWINTQMTGTSVTVVLIGPQTLGRPWVQYEIDRSQKEGKGLLGITMEGMKQSNGQLDNWTQYTAYGPFTQPYNTAPIYSWVHDNGRQNMSQWIEAAAKRAGR